MSLIYFKLNYATQFGQEIYICGSLPELGFFDESKALKMSFTGDLWQAEINLKKTVEFEYYYLLKERSETIRKEWGTHRKLCAVNKTDFWVNDYWKNLPTDNYLYSSAFTNAIFAHETTKSLQKYFPNTVLLRVACPFVKKGQRLLVSGDIPELGNWNLEQAPSFEYAGNGNWDVALNAQNLPDKFSYKFVIADQKRKKAVYWEEGENRVFSVRQLPKKNSVWVETGLQFRYNGFPFRGAGTAIPVFSLRSDDSFGIGDFHDLKKMVDWAEKTGQQLIQMLPINDTTTTKTWRDSYPYSAISSFALHPIYLGIKDFPLKSKSRMNAFLKEAKALNQRSELDYEKAFGLKLRYCEELFNQSKEEVFASESYHDFYEKNSFWLFAYTCYCHLRDKFGTAVFTDWGDFSIYNEEKLQQYIQNNTEAKTATDFYAFLQFLLDKQLADVQQYAHSKGITLKGDIPIGINRDSVDAWTSARLFNMDTQTGAPPDDFSVFGQNWGFPTYNWQAMEQESYAWWKNRFRKMADYFDAYRIDHILGFFRIWEIPQHSVQGLLGHFSPALPYDAEELSLAGISFDEERMTKPFIHEAFLPDLFGEHTSEVVANYLEISGWQRFKLKSECDTQRKIQQLFSDKTDEKSLAIKAGLYALCNDVLFVRDRMNHSRFHPRITAWQTYSFRYLDDNTKDAFYKLYEAFFYHRHNDFWREQAMKKLPELISSTSMLVCGEDLGMVPACVPSVMTDLQILSLEIERMPKDPNASFTDFDNLPYLSVCSTSTHDMSPIRLWWLENREVTQKYYNQILHRDGDAPSECSPQLCREILQRHLRSTAMWVILPWQDWMSISDKNRHENPAEERINIPSNPNHYWRYRMHISLDDLLKMDDLNAEIREMTQRNG